MCPPYRDCSLFQIQWSGRPRTAITEIMVILLNNYAFMFIWCYKYPGVLLNIYMKILKVFWVSFFLFIQNRVSLRNFGAYPGTLFNSRKSVRWAGHVYLYYRQATVYLRVSLGFPCLDPTSTSKGASTDHVCQQRGLKLSHLCRWWQKRLNLVLKCIIY